MSVRIFELEEWRILKAVQYFLLIAVENALAEATTPPIHTPTTSIDKLKFLRYEFKKLAISIESDREIQSQVASQFTCGIKRIFPFMEAVMVNDMPTSQFAEHHTFPGLWKLERIFYLAEAGGALDLSSLMVLPLQKPDAWFLILDALTTFNKTAESIFWTLPSAPAPPSGDPIRKNLIARPARRSQVETMLECLEDHFSKCPRQSGHEHCILLQASCQKWKIEESISATTELFLSSCAHSSVWQEVECSHLERSATLDNAFAVTDICDSISECLKYNDPLHLLTLDRELYKKINRQYAPGLDATPKKTIKYLLDHNMLLPWSPGIESSPLFNIYDKRELALSLCWCFLHLFDLDWIEKGWSADRIYLLSSLAQQSSPVITGSPPYITCQQPSMGQPESLRDPNKIFGESVFLSLAKLLVEIEIGRSITIEEKDKLGNPSLWLTIHKIIRGNQLSLACDDYIRAILGCLDLHRTFDQLVRNKPESNPGEFIYEMIVIYLENDWRNYQRRNLKRDRSGQILEKTQSTNKHYAKVVCDTRLTSLNLTQEKEASPEAETPVKRQSYPNKSTKVRSKTFDNRPKASIASSVVETHSPPTCRKEFEIAIICALEHEYTAVEDIIDQFWDDEKDSYGKLAGDPNDYSTGRIGEHNVVLVLLPEMGKSNASSAANSIRLSYTGVKLALVVGICGAVPKNGDKDIILGDVIIGERVIQHDFGRRYGDAFHRKSHNLGKASKEVSSITRKYKTHRSKRNIETQASQILKELQTKVAALGRQGEYDNPGHAADRLFKPRYRHRHMGTPECICATCFEDSDATCDAARFSTCEELRCDENEMIIREQRPSSHTTPMIHIGAIASGDTVMKSGVHRDTIATELGVIAFEMEGCGVWDELPCLVVKGVCDYADSHKDKIWQKFAAASAASVAKAIVNRYIKTDKPHGSYSIGRELDE